MKNKIACFMSISVLVACATPREREKSADSGRSASATSIEAKQVAAEQNAPFVAEVKFGKGSATLSAGDQNKLRSLVSKASGTGPIQEVHVISWADSEYPSESENELSENQKKLAQSRNEAVKKYLQSLHENLNVQTVSMAERPGALNELLRTDNVRIKESLESLGVRRTGSSASGASHSSKSMVLFQLQESSE